jgi:hypothetical protein
VKVAALIALVLALAVAACGGGNEASPEEQWASSVCTAMDTWKTDIASITTDATDALKDPGGAKDELSTAVGNAGDATQTLIDSLKDLGPPEVPEADAAQAQMDDFLDQAQAALDDVGAAASDITDASSLQALVTELSDLGTSLQSAVSAGQALIGSLEETADDLRQGFEDASSCDDLR